VLLKNHPDNLMCFVEIKIVSKNYFEKQLAQQA
jgi:hypothetical protein